MLLYVTSPPVMAYLDTAASTVVTCDVSSTALGEYLSQLHHDGVRPIAFASRTLYRAERKYSVSKCEARLACLRICDQSSRIVFQCQLITFIT